MTLVIMYRHLKKQEKKSKRDTAKYVLCKQYIDAIRIVTLMQTLVESDHLTGDCNGHSVDWSNNFGYF